FRALRSTSMCSRSTVAVCSKDMTLSPLAPSCEQFLKHYKACSDSVDAASCPGIHPVPGNAPVACKVLHEGQATDQGVDFVLTEMHSGFLSVIVSSHRRQISNEIPARDLLGQHHAVCD